MTDARHGWQEALAPSPDCIEIARLGEELDPAAAAHLESCARCQAELALFREFQRDETSPEEAEATQWIATELQRRFHDSGKVSGQVIPFRARAVRALYAVAATLLILIGTGYWMQMREPSISPTNDPGLYRSARLDVIAPVGDLSRPPAELRWTPVPNASRYRVQILEVDATFVWGGDTTASSVALPPDVVAQFAPGKSLLWEVRAFRGNELLASSETQTVRVSVSPLRKDP